MDRVPKKKLIIIALLLWVGITSWVIFVHQYKIMQDVPKQAPPVVRLHQDPQVVAVMKELMLDYSGLNLYYTADPTTPDTIATFHAPNTMYVRPDTDVNIVGQVVEHEYIHYIQVKDAKTAASFYPYLTDLYNTNNTLYDRMQGYRDDCAKGTGKCDFPDEIEAVACTETDYRILRKDFDDWCFKYLPMKYKFFPY